MFAGIMGIAVIVFALMSWNYKYVEGEKKDEDEKKRLSAASNHQNDSSSSSSSDDENEKGKENSGFSE